MMNRDKDRARDGDAFILVAVTDPVLHPEAVHVAAATTRPVIDLGEADDSGMRRHAHRAAAVLVDATTADALVGTRLPGKVFFLHTESSDIPWPKALACHAEQAFILPAQAPDILEALADLPVATTAATRGGGSAISVAFTGSCGGAGTSTTAALTARQAARRGHTVTLIDADPHSGGLDLLLGIEDVPGARWPDLMLTDTGGIDADDLRSALPHTSDGIGVLSAARSTVDDPFVLEDKQVTRIVDILSTGGLTLLDLPRSHAGNLGDLTVVIVPAEIRPAAAGRALVQRLRARQAEHVILTRHRGWSGLEDEELARVLGHRPSAALPHIASLARRAETEGLPTKVPAGLRAATEAVLEHAGVG